MTIEAVLDYANESIESPPIEKLMSVIERMSSIQWRSLTSTSDKVTCFIYSGEDSMIINKSNVRNTFMGQFLLNKELFYEYRLMDKPINQYYVTVEYKFVGKGRPFINTEMLAENQS